MSIVTMKSAEKFYATDVTKSLFCEGVQGQVKPFTKYLTTDAGLATVKPGAPVMRKTGAGGEAIAIAVTTDAALVYGFADFDPQLVADCDTAYAAGIKIPVIPIDKNIGAVLRNIIMKNPAANVNVDTPLCVELDTTGKVVVATEAALADAVTGHEAFDNGSATPGKNGAAGSTIHSRMVGRMEYYLANPAADARVVIRLTRA
jgi:hypothetical protein